MNPTAVEGCTDGGHNSLLRNAYHSTRNRVLRADIHERVTRVTLRHLARYQEADPYITSRDVLDVACGSGYGAMLLASARSYRGIDLDARAVAEARREFPEFSFGVGSVHDLPFDDSTFGGVVSFETLEHVPNPELALAEFARVLVPGGLVVASIPIDHPDTVYHVRPYSALECWTISTSCDELCPTVCSPSTIGRSRRSKRATSPRRLARCSSC